MLSSGKRGKALPVYQEVYTARPRPGARSRLGRKDRWEAKEAELRAQDRVEAQVNKAMRKLQARAAATPPPPGFQPIDLMPTSQARMARPIKAQGRKNSSSQAARKSQSPLVSAQYNVGTSQQKENLEDAWGAAAPRAAFDTEDNWGAAAPLAPLEVEDGWGAAAPLAPRDGGMVPAYKVQQEEVPALDRQGSSNSDEIPAVWDQTQDREGDLSTTAEEAVHSPQIDGDYYAMNSVHEQLWCQNTQGTAVPFRPSDEDMASAYGEQEGEEAAQDEQKSSNSDITLAEWMQPQDTEVMPLPAATQKEESGLDVTLAAQGEPLEFEAIHPLNVEEATEPMGYDETTASWTRWEGSFWEDDGWGDNNASFFAMPLPWVQSQDEPELDDDCTDDDDDQAKDGPAMPLLVDINDSKELLYGGLDSSSYGSDVAEEAADTTSIVWHDNAAWSLSDIGQVLEQEDAAQQVQTGAAVSIQAAFRGLKGRRLAASHVAARLFQQVQAVEGTTRDMLACMRSQLFFRMKPHFSEQDEAGVKRALLLACSEIGYMQKARAAKHLLALLPSVALLHQRPQPRLFLNGVGFEDRQTHLPSTLEACSWRALPQGARESIHSLSWVAPPTPDPLPTWGPQPHTTQQTEIQHLRLCQTPQQSAQVACVLAGNDELMVAAVAPCLDTVQLPTGSSTQQHSPSCSSSLAQPPATMVSADRLQLRPDKLQKEVVAEAHMDIVDSLFGSSLPAQHTTSLVQDTQDCHSLKPQQAGLPLIEISRHDTFPAELDSLSTVHSGASCLQEILPDADPAQIVYDRTDEHDTLAEQPEADEASSSFQPERGIPGHYHWCIDGQWCSVREAGLGMPASVPTHHQAPADSLSVSDVSASEAEIQPTAMISLQQHQIPSTQPRWKEQQHSSLATPTSQVQDSAKDVVGLMVQGWFGCPPAAHAVSDGAKLVSPAVLETTSAGSARYSATHTRGKGFLKKLSSIFR